MWHTSQGDRTLEGAEAELMQRLVESLLEDLLLQFDEDWQPTEDWSCDTGVELFDNLHSEQQIALLHDVAQHLLEPTPEGMPLSAIAEATVAALFAELHHHVEIELDLAMDADNVHWRRLIRNAALQCLQRDDLLGLDSSVDDVIRAEDVSSTDFRVPEVQSIDCIAWGDVIETLADQILWDRDFEMASLFLDEDPRRSATRREVMGIDANYFVQIAPDPRPHEMSSLVSETQALIRRRPR
ncbi:hypothetical protein LOC71_06435 [Rhodopirellula sp. JC740]|uniref:Hemerythrin-like domain-containing protein n=2 Tax=Rhodopirellula halodulae TaxID=2894198 RepID=A0ABS8NHE5_9BACT|nr:hypothetical protein [Rhodopirellula sp. JC740]MCC9641906.1 hypothetical protein [Rhodopirellula sp. JC740]MCC9654214.1 hypothetical protein [Rhodopirellula sp. JC737]